MFEKIINNYLKDIKSGKKIGEQEMVNLLAQTVSYLSNDPNTFLNETKGYVVYSFNQTAANLAKGTIPDDEQGLIDKRLDLAISAVMDYLKEKKVISNRNRMLLSNRLSAAIHMLTYLTALPDEKAKSGLLNELKISLVLWLESFVDEDAEREKPLKAAETECEQ